MDYFPIILILVTGLSSAATAILMAYLGRRKDRADIEKTTAETERTESETRHTEVAYYREMVDSLVIQVRTLDERIKELEAIIAKAQETYERRVGNLHSKIDSLRKLLDQANERLEKADNTIDQLRQKVEDGNTIIAELREQVTQLLVKLAEKKE